MKYFTRHKPSGARAERSIFGTIFKAMVGVLLVEVALLVASIYAMRVGPQLDQNAEDTSPCRWRTAADTSRPP